MPDLSIYKDACSYSPEQYKLAEKSSIAAYQYEELRQQGELKWQIAIGLGSIAVILFCVVALIHFYRIRGQWWGGWTIRIERRKD